jgi:DNA-binding transcriptional ArsR family regulator
MTNKVSCVRTKVNQNLINKLHVDVKLNEEEFEDYSKHLSLLGNTARLKIIKLISENKLCVCDLIDILDMSIPAVSQHLRKLKDAKLIANKKEGQTIYQYLSKDFPPILMNIINKIKL